MNIDEIIDTEFQLDDEIIYLNHAAVSPWPLRTAVTVKQFADENLHYGATNYPEWIKTESRLRGQLQRLINAESIDDIALLKNTSEALSVVACGLDWHPGENIISTNEEFPSNRIPWQAQIKKGIEFREIDISVSKSAEQQLIDACDDKTRIVTVSSVQYGSGRRLNLEVIGNFCHKNNILFCVDAIQSLGVIPFDVQKIKADFVMADAHKWLLGPEGIALFYCAGSVRNQIDLHQFGWHMVENPGNYDAHEWQPASSAKRFECGSPNMLGIYALSASLSLLEEAGIENISRIIFNNTNYIIDFINNNYAINLLSPQSELHRAGIVTFQVANHDNAKIHTKLMDSKVICANRMGGIRFSPHFYTTKNKIDKALEILSSII